MSSRLLRLAEVKARTGLSKTTIYKLTSEGRFPKKHKINGTASSAWREDELDQWVDGHHDLRPRS